MRAREKFDAVGGRTSRSAVAEARRRDAHPDRSPSSTFFALSRNCFVPTQPGTLIFPRALKALFLLLASVASAQSSCIDCHEAQRDPVKASAHPDLSCTDCHNGDDKAAEQDAAHSAAKKFIGRPAPPQLANMCADCHKKPSEAWKLSPHFEGMVKGDPAGASCASCHSRAPDFSSHAIVDCDDQDSPTQRPIVHESCARCHSSPVLMGQSGLRTDAASLYATSAHSHLLHDEKDLDGATCTDCHKAHEAFRSSDPRSETNVRNQSATCGECHGDANLMKKHGISLVAAKFDASPHARNLGAGAPSCASCHGPHAARNPDPSEVRALCAKCHQGPANELARGPHGKATWTDPASGVASPVTCLHCHDSHGAPRPEPPFADAACAACHDKASKEFAAGVTMSEYAAATRADLFELHGLLTKAQSRGHDLGERCEALAALDGESLQLAAVSHGVRPESCRRIREGFAKDAKPLRDKLKEMTPGERPLGWLPALWGFLFVGVAMMWARSRR